MSDWTAEELSKHLSERDNIEEFLERQMEILKPSSPYHTWRYEEVFDTEGKGVLFVLRNYDGDWIFSERRSVEELLAADAAETARRLEEERRVAESKAQKEAAWKRVADEKRERETLRKLAEKYPDEL